MLNLNRAQIIGNLTRDPELRYTPNGQAVTSFGVATNRRWTSKSGEQQEQTEFHDVVAWGKLAEIANQILHKGNKAYIEGRLQTRSWESQDGQKRQRTEIIAENIIALSPKAATSEGVTDSMPTKTETENVPTETTPEKKTEKSKKTESKPASPAGGPKDEPKEEEINLDDIPF